MLQHKYLSIARKGVIETGVERNVLKDMFKMYTTCTWLTDASPGDSQGAG